MHRLIPNITSLTITIITIMVKRISISYLNLTIKIYSKSKMKDIRLSNRLGILKDMIQNNKARKLSLWSSQSKSQKLISLINRSRMPSTIRLKLSLKIDNNNLKIYHRVDFNKGIRYSTASIMIYVGKSVESSM